MTDDQKAVAEALSRCTFLPASSDKRFARDVGTWAKLPLLLTKREAVQLNRLAWKYRHQMPPHLVPLEKPE